MQIVFKIKKSDLDKQVIEIIVKSKGKIIRTEVGEAEDALIGLDKILKKNKIKIGEIRSIKIDNQNKNRYTSYRILKSIEKAIKFSLLH